MTTQTTHRILIGWLILALLLAQGLRVCIHAYDAPHAAEHSHDVVATHLESTFSQLDDHGEAVSDVHITLIGVLKNFAVEPLFIALLAALLFILPIQKLRLLWIARPCERIFDLPYGHYFNPPLRAPPR